MERNGPFKGRTIAVVNDLSLDEQRYLYKKSRELKRLVGAGSDVSAFKIDDRNYQAYLIFMEDSTRTRESFRNAAKFLGCRTNIFDAATSSFNKNESITDAIKMLYGYSADSCFILRTKLEGTCRWLQGALSRYAESSGGPRPGFINAGDGKHEHPTQEFLDEFSFLEKLDWNEDHIHIALTGDLYHGRTVSFKADGLRVFKNVEVDLVAPDLLSLPPYYVEKMKANGFEIRLFESVDEYLASGKVAPLWYFTRLQLERMGDAVLERAPSLRKSVTFRKDMLGLLPEGTKFYHPLPRDRLNPTNPTFLDELPLNGWDAQSANGYWTRIIEIGMVSGLLGHDFEGAFAMEPDIVEDFIIEAPAPRTPETGIQGRNQARRGRNRHRSHSLRASPLKKYGTTSRRCGRSSSSTSVRATASITRSRGPRFSKASFRCPTSSASARRTLKKLAAIAPGCTLNLIRNSKVAKKISARHAAAHLWFRGNILQK